MKTATKVVFTVSLTAGTACLIYSGVKSYFIKKLVKSLMEKAKKLSKEFDEKYLKEQLDKLYLWEVKSLSTYWEKANKGASEKEIGDLIKKLKDQKIMEKADLKSVDTILFGT